MKKTLGQIGFEAYNAFDSSVRVPWEALDARVQAGWERAGEAIAAHVDVSERVLAAELGEANPKGVSF